MTEQERDDPELSDEQRLVVDRLTTDELESVDRALLVHVTERWRKVAMVVAKAMSARDREGAARLPDLFYAERVRLLVSKDAIESVGNLRRMRFSEVRRFREIDSAGDASQQDPSIAALRDQLETLEAQVLTDPDSRDLREELLSLYVGARKTDSPRRYEHILWYVQHHPRTSFARCPFTQVHRKAAPAAYDAIERLWRSHFEDNPTDGCIARGLASFIVEADRPRALAVLEGFLRVTPSDSETWVDLGRMTLDPAQRLAHFQEARARGSAHPNLVAWIARSAIEADDREAAARAGQDLLDLAASARRPADHSFYKHWGHTTSGIVAVRSGDVDSAVQHLHESAAIPGDYRLSSYGPSFILADELCVRGRWSDVAQYLEACEAFWAPAVLRALRVEVEQAKRPSFPYT